MQMPIEEWLSFIEAQQDDVATFIDCNRGEIEELFETGSVTVNYSCTDGTRRSFEISLNIEEVSNG